jgi:hypothetical protein
MNRIKQSVHKLFVEHSLIIVLYLTIFYVILSYLSSCGPDNAPKSDMGHPSVDHLGLSSRWAIA